MSMTERGTCAYCGKSQRQANVACPYNRTAHAQYIGTVQRDDETIPVYASPMTAALLAEASEITVGGMPVDVAPAADTGGTFDGFSGGDSGGGGASDTWES